MTDIFAISELSMLNDIRRLDMISHNIANATTHGYKRDLSVARSFADQLQSGLTDASPLQSLAGSSVPSLSSFTDFRQGAFTKTDNRLDVAIEGEGFFEFNTGSQLLYSRQGNFHLDHLGRLMSASNHLVNGLSGEIRLTTEAPRIDKQGVVWDAEEAVAQLKIVKFNDLKLLQKNGDGSYLLAENGRVETLLNPSMRQGFLETSNVEVMEEMVNMMATVRHFEATQHVIQGYDEILNTAIETIAEF